MGKKRYLDSLISQKLFRLDHLDIIGIDNEPAVRVFSETVLEQEACLFANKIVSGDEYCHFLHNMITSALQKHKPLPVARFADGEYAFYNYTLACNGLYKQAESVEAIKTAMPEHIAAMKYVAANGFFAPLIFPGNVQTSAGGFFSFFQSKKNSSGADFLDFLYAENITLNSSNYIPFYVVYAYLSSAEFAAAMNGKNICILNSEYNKESGGCDMKNLVIVLLFLMVGCDCNCDKCCSDGDYYDANSDFCYDECGSFYDDCGCK